MNRALYIVIIPTLLVGTGYAIVLREAGIREVFPGWMAILVLFLACLIWLSWRSGRRTRTGRAK